MRRLVVGLAAIVALVVLSAVPGCHLADTPDAVKCAGGTHPMDGHCVVDEAPFTTVTIALDEAGTSCAVAPDSITVAPSGDFAFRNEDSVDHAISGADGVAWATAKAGQTSPLIAITKAGRWAYTISGCATGGTVVVQ